MVWICGTMDASDMFKEDGGSGEVFLTLPMSSPPGSESALSAGNSVPISAFLLISFPKSILGIGLSRCMSRVENLLATSVLGLPPPNRSGSNEREGRSRSVRSRKELGKEIVESSSRHSLFRLGET